MQNRGEKVQRIIRSLIRLTISFTVLYVIRLIILSLPGLNALIPFIPLTFAVVGRVAVGVLMIAVIMRFERELAEPLRNGSRTQAVRGIMANSVYLAAIYITYISFLPLINRFLPSFIWAYSLALFLVAIIPIVRISLAFYRSIDKLTDIITRRIVYRGEEAEDELVRCPFCSYKIPTESKFCFNCGGKL